MEQKKTIALLKALAEPSRIKVLKALRQQPQYGEELSERLALAASTMSFHLKKLEHAGLIYPTKDQYYTVYSVNEDLLEMKLSDLLFVEETESEEQEKRLQAYRLKVLKSFLKDGKLTRIPVQRKKKRIILEEILNAFEKGRVYCEKDVNTIISDFHDDFCTIRREFICEKMMKRDNGMYERI